MSKRQKAHGLLNYLIREKTFSVVLMFILLIAVCIICWLKIPVEIMPREKVPPFLYLQVQASSPSSAEKMELALTIPVEGILRSQSGLKEFRSSTNKRAASFSLTYRSGTNMDLAYFSLQEGLQDLSEKGLFTMKNVTISKFNPEAEAIIKVSVSDGGKINDPVKLIKGELKLRMESIPGVAKIVINGLEPVNYNYRIPWTKLAEHGITPTHLSKALNVQDLRTSIGNVTLGNSTDFLGLKARMLTKDLKKIKKISLKGGKGFQLNKLASERVVDKFKEDFSRKNGDNVVFIEIYNKESANLFKLRTNINNFFSSLKDEKGDLKHLKFDFVMNKTEDLKKAIGDVFESLYTAIIITFIVVFVFLRKVKLTLIISSVIPITILLTVAILFVKGSSLNILTLSGLILSIGLIVDNAIVVSERIEKLMEREDDQKLAAALGAKDVALPLLMSTLTTVIIFLPAAFIESGDSFTDMLKAFQVPVIGSLMASYFVALVFVPIATLGLAKKSGKAESKTSSEEEIPRWIINLFTFTYKRKYLISIVIGFGLIVLLKSIAGIEESDIETPRDSYTSMNIEFTPETKEADRKKLFQKLENQMIEAKESLGYKFMVSDYSPKLTSGTINFYPNDDAKDDISLNLLDKKIKIFAGKREQVPGMKVTVGQEDFEFGKERRKLVVQLQGPKNSKIRNILQDMKDQILEIEGMEEVNTQTEERGNLSFVFLPNESIMAQYNLKLGKLSESISQAMSSFSISNLNFNGKTVGATISLMPPGEKWNLEAVKNLKIPTGENRYVSLMDLGRLVTKKFLTSISRKQGISKGELHVYFPETVSEDRYDEMRGEVEGIVDDYNYPRGFGKPEKRSSAKIEEMRKKGNFVIYLSVFLIYLLMASLFESPLIPFSILFTVPLAIIFGVAGLHFLKFTLDPMARLGLIILVGIVVNNAIILIDVILKLKSEGLRRENAIIIGCSSRLKAIIMTSATTILGVLPVAMGNSKIMGIPYSTLGICIISGMLFSTFITLVLLPLIYEIFDGVESKIKSFLGQ